MSEKKVINFTIAPELYTKLKILLATKSGKDNKHITLKQYVTDIIEKEVEGIELHV